MSKMTDRNDFCNVKRVSQTHHISIIDRKEGDELTTYPTYYEPLLDSTDAMVGNEHVTDGS